MILSRRVLSVVLIAFTLVAACSSTPRPAPTRELPAATALPAPPTASVAASEDVLSGAPAPGPTPSAKPAPDISPTAWASATTAPTSHPRVGGSAAPLPAATAVPTVTAAQATSLPSPVAQPAAPGPTPDGQERSLRVPILMYHYISNPPPGSDVYRRDLSVAPARFESHLAYLRDAGYHVVTLDDLLYALTQGRALPDKPVVLTFDDGYEDNYTNAFPLLQKYGVTGHFFLITDFVNANYPAYMTWPQIETMARAGQRFGSHTRNHPDLRGKSVDYLVWQALGSTEAIEQHLGYHPRWIAYPSGAYDSRTIAVFKSANYWGGLTTSQGALHSSNGLFELSRVRIRGRYTADDVARLLKLNW